jgi:hypothetical protein
LIFSLALGESLRLAHPTSSIIEQGKMIQEILQKNQKKNEKFKKPHKKE